MRRFLSDQRGTGMVEFAFVTPILLLIYTGIYEFWYLLELKQKAIELTRYYSWEMAFRHPQTGENWGAHESEIKDEMQRELTPFKAVDAKLQASCTYKKAADDAFIPVLKELVVWMVEGFDFLGWHIGLGLPMSNDKMICQVEVSYVPQSFGFILNTKDDVNWTTGDRFSLGGNRDYSRSGLILFNWKAEPVNKDYQGYVKKRVKGIWCGGLLNNSYLEKLMDFITKIPIIGHLLQPINDYLLNPQVFLDYLGE